MASLVRAISRRQVMPRRPGAQHPQHAIHHLPRLAPRTAAIVRTPRLAEFDQRSDQVPLHIREVCHTSDVLEILPRCNCLFAGDIYEIASQFSVLSSLSTSFF